MSFCKNVITFGASSKIENKMEEFRDLKEKYECLYKHMENRQMDVNKCLQELIEVKVECVKSLKKITEISSNLRIKDRDYAHQAVGGEIQFAEFEEINNTITAADMAMDMTKGASAGVSTALGTWALVSSFGSASTGTAIAGLSGAAATNATLAWLGGGALAAGGGGIAAGTAVLGGIVVLPALVLSGVFSHMKANKQIAEIENKMLQIIRDMNIIQANILKFDLLEKRCSELILTLNKSKEVFDNEFKKIYKQIYPSFLSKSWMTIRKRFLWRNYFSNEDVKNISYICGIATEFSMLINKKPIEE